MNTMTNDARLESVTFDSIFDPTTTWDAITPPSAVQTHAVDVVGLSVR